MEKYRQPLCPKLFSFVSENLSFALNHTSSRSWIIQGFLHPTNSSKCPLANKWQGPGVTTLSLRLYLHQSFKQPNYILSKLSPRSKLEPFYKPNKLYPVLSAVNTLRASAKPSLISALPLRAFLTLLTQVSTSSCPRLPSSLH